MEKQKLTIKQLSHIPTEKEIDLLLDKGCEIEIYMMENNIFTEINEP